ncbi:MAG: FAD-dependent oxidoreductase, partial [Caulobacterales bacterium]
ARAERTVPGLGAADWRAATGVRAEVADGLPLVGKCRTEGVWLAVGARRNGWLLAPLIAQTILRSFRGEASGAAARFDPARLAATAPG